MGLEGFRTIKWGPYDLAADADALKFKIAQAPSGFAFKVVAARASAKTAVTAADTDYNTLNLKNGSIVCASLANGPASGGVSVPIGTSASGAFTLGSSVVVSSGESLVLVPVKTGTGLAIEGLQIEVDVEYIHTAT